MSISLWIVLYFLQHFIFTSADLKKLNFAFHKQIVYQYYLIGHKQKPIRKNAISGKITVAEHLLALARIRYCLCSKPLTMYCTYDVVYSRYCILIWLEIDWSVKHKSFPGSSKLSGHFLNTADFTTACMLHTMHYTLANSVCSGSTVHGFENSYKSYIKEVNKRKLKLSLRDSLRLDKIIINMGI